MSEDEQRIVTEAAAWHAASRDDGMDWADFTAWLEADPRHLRAYDEIALIDALIDEHRQALRHEAGQDDPGEQLHPSLGASPRRLALQGRIGRIGWLGWAAGGAIAASLAALLLASQFLGQPTVYETQGRPQHIALADGSSVMLAPHSRLTVAGSAQDRLALSGGAWFDIRHDPDRALAITAGALEIRDIGTRFDVQAAAKSVRVAVVAGAVSVDSAALSQQIRLEPGRSLTFDVADGTALVRSTQQPAIGAWREGRLVYEDTPLPLVLDDLYRYAGVRVTLPDSLRNRRFSGSLITGDGEAAIRDLAEVMDLRLDRDGDLHRLGERSR